jgi:hypothetical protein
LVRRESDIGRKKKNHKKIRKFWKVWKAEKEFRWGGLEKEERGVEQEETTKSLSGEK